MRDDLLVQSRFRNNILYKLMEGKSVSKCAEEIGVWQTTFGMLLNLKKSPILKTQRHGQKFCTTAVKIAEHYKYLVEDLFPPSLYAMNLPEVFERVYASEDLLPLLAAKNEPDPLQLPDAILQQAEIRQAINDSLAHLNTRSRLLMEMRFGLNGSDTHTLDDLAAHFCITRERVRQIEAKALRQLRHPDISHPLREFTEGESNA